MVEITYPVRFEQGYYTDAEEKWRKVYAGRCEILGEDAADTLYALCWLGRFVDLFSLRLAYFTPK